MHATHAVRLGSSIGFAALALVVGIQAVSAGEVEVGAAVSGSLVGLIGGISDSELQQLEHATVAEATIARLAAMEKADSVLASGVRIRSSGVPSEMTDSIRLARRLPDNATVGTSDADVDVFPISGRVMPLLVTRPISEAVAAQPRLTFQSGLAETVGVTRSSLRSPTPRERDPR